MIYINKKCATQRLLHINICPHHSLNINFAFKYNLHLFSTVGFDERASPKFMPDDNEER